MVNRMLVGPEENQDMVPVAGTGTNVLDPRVKAHIEDMGPAPRTFKGPSRSDFESKFMGSRLKRPRAVSDADDEDDFSAPPRRFKKQKQKKRDERRYRPSSPTESVNSDLELLANKSKTKDPALSEPAPMDRLGESLVTENPHAADDFSGSEDDASGDDGSGDDYSGDESDFSGSGSESEAGDFQADSARARHGGDNKAPRLTYDETINQKAAILAYLDRRTASGEKLEYNDSMTLEQLTLLKQKDTIKARGTHMIKILRQGITIYVSLLELISKKVPALNLDLTDFSKEMFNKRNDYDDLLWEIIEEHGEQMKLSPIVMLLVSVTGQAIVYSAARNFVKNVQFGMGIGPAPVPVAPAGPGAGQGDDSGIVEPPEISGPVGFNQSDLLEICRREAESKLDQTGKPQQLVLGQAQLDNGGAAAVLHAPPADADEVVQIDVPNNPEDQASQVQILRVPRTRKPRQARKPQTRTPTAAGPGQGLSMDPIGAVASADSSAGPAIGTGLWDPGVDV